MKAVYLDASAFVKTVLPEPESEALDRYLADAPARWVSSALLRTEALRAVRHLGSDRLATTRSALRRVDLVPVDTVVLESAGILEPAIVRTLDAIHVATAMELGDDLTSIVTYDRRMIKAARSLGLRTTSPR